MHNSQIDVTVDECFETTGFEEARTLQPASAKNYADEYRNSLNLPDSITGGIITRAAFDSLLCDSAVNAIAYVLAKDNSGSVGPGGNGVFMFFTGVNVVLSSSSDSIEAVKNLKLPIYAPQHWCPPTCIANH